MSSTYHPEGCACGAHDDDNRGVTRRDLLKSLGGGWEDNQPRNQPAPQAPLAAGG